MNKVLIFIAFFSFLSDSFSQNPEIIQLAQRITWDIHDDSLKVIAICHWMIDNISYDRNNAALDNPKDEASNVNIIVKRKKAICAGYANLFKSLCTLNNINAEIINGYALGLGYEIAEQIPIDRDNHAWNAVKINNRWYLMDITWADNDDGTYDAEYLWADPSVFIKKHLPDDPFWQFLDDPVSLDCFIYAKNCNDKIVSKPNNGQHISEAFKLDSIERTYNYFKRAIGFNQDNIELIRQAAYFFLQRGDDALNEYYKLKEQQKKTFDVFKDKESILLPLRKSKSYFEVSIKFYGKIYYKTGELNADNIKYDASKIKETDHEIEMIELYFKQTNRR